MSVSDVQNAISNDNVPCRNAFSLDELAQASGLNKDALLQRMAGILLHREEMVTEVVSPEIATE